MWYRLADRLGMPLQRCMCETTSEEFVEWQEYFEIEENIPRHEDYYLAQIAAEVRRGMVKTPLSVKLDHFLLKFTKRSVQPTEDRIKRQTAISKAYWFRLLGMKPPKEEQEE